MLIEFRDVTKKFGHKVVLNRISFSLEKGEIVFLLGQSGVGKSVTLKTLVGLLSIDEGEIFLQGEAIHKFSEIEFMKVRQACGMVFQHPALLDSLNVLQNITYGVSADAETKLSLARKCLNLVYLSEDLLYKSVQELSFGMQKRVSIARTLAMRPQILLFDEPTTGLDPITTKAINDLILELSRELKITSIVVSHDIACALQIADRVLFLDHGKLLFNGPTNVLKKSEHPLIKSFLSEVSPI